MHNEGYARVTPSVLVASMLLLTLSGCPDGWRWWGHHGHDWVHGHDHAADGGRPSHPEDDAGTEPADDDAGASDEDAGASQACGGLRGLSCSNGDYCSYAADANCGRADATGTCATVPDFCTLERNPVCGCDGQTYGNPCTAAAAGISVDHTGECS
ncbi:MAG: Kazal-type serine protease inhibitor family protein [Polyangiales bacterium]